MLTAVNFHLIKACNLRCKFCFATFRDVNSRLSTEEAHTLIDVLATAGTQKLNFVGGEPTLHRHIGALIEHTKAAGMVTSIVSNGFRLGELLKDHGSALDWAGLSIDSGFEGVQADLGRGEGEHIARSITLAQQCRAAGVRVKLNTVVTRTTWREDMSPLVRLIRPERWKIFQVLPIDGQNDGSVEDLLINPEQFEAFVARHAHLKAEGLEPVVENNDAMQGSYVMVDPRGRFFGNATGRQIYSDPILDVGVEVALAQVGFVPEKFEARGGTYAW